MDGPLSGNSLFTVLSLQDNLVRVSMNYKLSCTTKIFFTLVSSDIQQLIDFDQR